MKTEPKPAPMPAASTGQDSPNPVDVVYSVCGEFNETQRILILDGLLLSVTEVNAVGKCGWTLLHRAACEGEERLVEVLLKRPGINVEARCGQDEETALLLAAQNGKAGVVRLLLQGGADPRAKDKNGVSALEMAVRHEHWDVAEALIGAVPDVNSVDQDNGWTLLHYWAGCHGYRDLVPILCKRGADVNARGSAGETALMVAAANGHVGSVLVLIVNGADYTLKDKNGYTALDHAKRNNHPETIDSLERVLAAAQAGS